MDIGITKGTDKSLGSTNTGKVISAVMLSSSKVFIAHSSNTDNNYLYGVVCTISGTSITKGTDTQLTNVVNAGAVISTVMLSSSKVFIAFCATTANILSGIVCNISGTSITAGTYEMLLSNTYTADVISVVALSSTSVFIAHVRDNSKYLYGMVCTISGTSITTGTDTQLSTIVNSGATISAVMLSSTKVFIAHSNTASNNYLRGVVCTISGTSITKGTDSIINSTVDTGVTISEVMLSSTKVFIAYAKLDGNYKYLRGIVCTISGTSITAGTETIINNGVNSGVAISAVMLTSTKVFIAHSNYANCYLYGVVCIISGTTITKGTDTQLTNVINSGAVISAVMLSSSKVFIAHSYSSNYNLYGLLCDIENTTGLSQLKSSSDTILGIAQTAGASNSKVNVYTPNV